MKEEYLQNVKVVEKAMLRAVITSCLLFFYEWTLLFEIHVNTYKFMQYFYFYFLFFLILG